MSAPPIASIRFTIPLHTVSEANARSHRMAKAGRVKAQRKTTTDVVCALVGPRCPLPTPLVVELVRLAPSSGLDDDNLTSALKATRDALAKWLGVDDRKRDVVRYEYDQRREKTYGVEVCIRPMEEEC